MSDYEIPAEIRALIALCDHHMEMAGCPAPKIIKTTWDSGEGEKPTEGPRVLLVYGDTFNDCLELTYDWGREPRTREYWDGTTEVIEPRQAPECFCCSMPIPNEVIDGRISSTSGRYRRCGAKFTTKNLFKFIQYGRRWVEARHLSMVHQKTATSSRLKGLSTQKEKAA